jgi:hypothetical protein
MHLHGLNFEKVVATLNKIFLKSRVAACGLS